ncbi:MAG: DinB family protein [Gemmatimonadales bacterium]
MTFANPASNASTAAAGYVRALLDLLGSQDPLAVLDALLPWLERRTASLDPAALRRAEAPGKWSVIEVIQHLADAELVMGFRIRMVLTGNEPELQGYDQDRWVSALRYAEVPLDLALGQLRGTRNANLRLLRTLTPEQRERVGLHSERGRESVGLMLRMMAGHDLVHRRQIDRILGPAAGGG